METSRATQKEATKSEHWSPKHENHKRIKKRRRTQERPPSYNKVKESDAGALGTSEKQHSDPQNLESSQKTDDRKAQTTNYKNKTSNSKKQGGFGYAMIKKMNYCSG